MLPEVRCMRLLVLTAAVAIAVMMAPSVATSATRTVPNVVGKNHQAAQDYLQSKGFFYLRERDCSGRGRLLLWDRNWRVVKQSPKAGARVSTKRTITLCSVKYSD